MTNRGDGYMGKKKGKSGEKRAKSTNKEYGRRGKYAKGSKN